MDNRKSKRPKQVIRGDGKGLFDIHDCKCCLFSKKVPLNILRIAYFRSIVEYNDSKEVSTSLKIYTHSLQKVLKSI